MVDGAEPVEADLLASAGLPSLAPIGHSASLDDAMAAVWAWFDDYGILRNMAADAVLARTSRGELMLGTPRLLQLLVDGTLSISDAVLIVRSLATEHWEPPLRTQINDVLDAWWYEALRLEAGEHEANESGQRYVPGVALGILAQYSNNVPAPHSVPMGRWLDVWMAALDGPGAVHLAAAVIPSATEHAWANEAWVDVIDSRHQFFAWARSEPILNGLTLIGGTHIALHADANPEAPTLDDVLDQLL